MLIYNLAISCFVMSNLPCFMDLNFRFLCNIFLYSIVLYFQQHTLSQLEYRFCFSPASSFFLELIVSALCSGNPLQYSCLENTIDRGAWWATHSSWGFKELDMTEWLTHTFFPSIILDTFWPEGSSSIVITFCLFIWWIVFSLQEYWSC